MPKLTKEEAGYDDRDSIGRRCGNCRFLEGSILSSGGSYGCSKVLGKISPIRCCNLWRGHGVSDGAFPRWLSGADVNRKLGEGTTDGLRME